MISGWASDWIHQLSATCDDKNASTLGPWGNATGYRHASFLQCHDGYNQGIIRNGPFIHQLILNCSFPSQSIVIGISPDGSNMNEMKLAPNQSIVGLQVYYNSSGIRAIRFEYAEFPSKSPCVDSIGQPNGECPRKGDWLAIAWGFLTVVGVVAVVGSIMAYIYRKRRKKLFLALDSILPLT